MQVGRSLVSWCARLCIGVGLLAVACAPAAPSAPSAPAKPAAAKPAAGAQERPFYEGKTVRLIVGLAAGGGYDTYTRAIARHLPRYLPGNPTTIVENMVGASGLVAANHVYKVAPQDGTVVHNFVGGLTVQELLKNPGVEFESARFHWLGAPTPDNFACVVRKEAGVTSLSQARGASKELIIGGIAPGGSTDDVPKILRTALDLNLKIITGYSGTSRIRLAMDAGEVDGACYAWESWKATSSDRVASGDLVVLGQAPERPLADLPNVPRFLEVAPSEEARQLILHGIVARSRIERPYLVGPNVPRERVELLRQAFTQTLKDPAFLEDAAKANLDIDPVSGEEIEQRVRELFALPESLKDRLRTILTAD